MRLTEVSAVSAADEVAEKKSAMRIPKSWSHWVLVNPEAAALLCAAAAKEAKEISPGWALVALWAVKKLAIEPDEPILSIEIAYSSPSPRFGVLRGAACESALASEDSRRLADALFPPGSSLCSVAEAACGVARVSPSFV